MIFVLFLLVRITVVKIKLDLEAAILSVFFILFLFIGPGNTFNHRIQHDFPYAYLASDPFQHQTRAEAIKDAGNFRYEAPYISLGFEGAVGRYPPVIYHLAVIFSYAAGIEVYDSIYFLVFLFIIISALVMYLIVRNFNKHVALMSLPLPMLVFTLPPAIGFFWGHWPSLLSQSFIMGLFWAFTRIDLKKSFILISAFLSSIIMTHTSEAVFAVIFIALFFLVRLISKNLKIDEIKTVFVAAILIFVVAFYYLIIFGNTFARGEHYSFAIEPEWSGTPGFYISNFGSLLIFMVAGILFAIFKIKNMHTSLIMAFTMLIGGHLNYIGFGLRSFQLRFLWPIYLAVFLGFGLYMLSKIIIKNWNFIYTLAICLILTVVLFGIVKTPWLPHYEKLNSQGLMDPYHWSALTWLSKNTEANAKIYFFYGDIYSQDALLRNSKRIHYQVDTDDFVKAIQNKKIKRSYKSELPGDGGGGVMTRTGLFSFDQATKGKPQEYFSGPKDICNFNYLVFDKGSRQPVLAQYNLLIANELLKKEYMKVVLDNGYVMILKNNKAGADCIEERNF